jgi:hypothetical protein
VCHKAACATSANHQALTHQRSERALNGANADGELFSQRCFCGKFLSGLERTRLNGFDKASIQAAVFGHACNRLVELSQNTLAPCHGHEEKTLFTSESNYYIVITVFQSMFSRYGQTLKRLQIGADRNPS